MILWLGKRFILLVTLTLRFKKKSECVYLYDSSQVPVLCLSTSEVLTLSNDERVLVEKVNSKIVIG